MVGHWMAGEIRRSCRVFQQRGEVVRLLLMKDGVVQRVVEVQRDTMGDVQEVLIPSRRVVVVLVVAVVADILKGLIRSMMHEKNFLQFLQTIFCHWPYTYHHNRQPKEGEEPRRCCHAVEDAETI